MHCVRTHSADRVTHALERTHQVLPKQLLLYSGECDKHARVENAGEVKTQLDIRLERCTARARACA